MIQLKKIVLYAILYIRSLFGAYIKIQYMFFRGKLLICKSHTKFKDYDKC